MPASNNQSHFDRPGSCVEQRSQRTAMGTYGELCMVIEAEEGGVLGPAVEQQMHENQTAKRETRKRETPRRETRKRETRKRETRKRETPKRETPKREKPDGQTKQQENSDVEPGDAILRATRGSGREAKQKSGMCQQQDLVCSATVKGAIDLRAAFCPRK